MFLELTTTPDDALYGGLIGFAHVPWQLPLCECEHALLANCVRKTVDTFMTQYGTSFRFRLVLESRAEWHDAVYFVPPIAPLPDGWPSVATDERMLAQYLDLDEVVPPGPRGLSPIEQDAVAALQRIMRDFENQRGVRPTQWTLSDEVARKNLARAAEHVGLKIVAPEQEKTA